MELLWGVFNGPCRDLNELRHLVGLLFPKYLEPVTKGKRPVETMWIASAADTFPPLRNNPVFARAGACGLVANDHTRGASARECLARTRCLPPSLRHLSSGLAGRDDGSTLYRHIAPQLKQQLSKLYLRETSTAEWSKSEAAVGKVPPQHSICILADSKPNAGTRCGGGSNGMSGFMFLWFL